MNSLKEPEPEPVGLSEPHTAEPMIRPPAFYRKVFGKMGIRTNISTL